MKAVFSYLKEINSIYQGYSLFVIHNFDFLPKAKTVLTEMEYSKIQFLYGCGIEDPHIWNFRVISDSGKIQTLTTDFDYFLPKINLFWELGYLYATFRWIKKNNFYLGDKAQAVLLSLIQDSGLKSQFMFWLGVLSSYCGYKDSIFFLVKDKKETLTAEQKEIIRQLDDKVFGLANELIEETKLLSSR